MLMMYFRHRPYSTINQMSGNRGRAELAGVSSTRSCLPAAEDGQVVPKFESQEAAQIVVSCAFYFWVKQTIWTLANASPCLSETWCRSWTKYGKKLSEVVINGQCSKGFFVMLPVLLKKMASKSPSFRGTISQLRGVTRHGGHLQHFCCRGHQGWGSWAPEDGPSWDRSCG